MTLCLAREHCITISEDCVYRLMKQMRLPQMSTVKPPKAEVCKEDAGVCQNLLSIISSTILLVHFIDYGLVQIDVKFVPKSCRVTV